MRVRRAVLVCSCVALVAWDHPTLAQTPEPQTDRRTAPPQSPREPRSLGINGQLTSWLQVRGEFRARIEGFSGGGFAATDDAYWMDRFRLTATVRPAKSIVLVAQAQDARAFDKTTGSEGVPFRNTLDLRLAYGELGSNHTIRLGRQELAFGEQRLLGHLVWANTARAWDGARATFKLKRGQLDAFAATLVATDPARFDKSGSGHALYGGYGSFSKLLPRQVVEPYFIWRQSRGLTPEFGGTATLHQATTGLRMAGKLPRSFDYSGEAAVQMGSLGPDDIRAWAEHALVGKTLTGAPAQLRLFGEYNCASGDANHADGTRGTFDQLYPTGHDKVGLADQVGWRNVRHVRTGVDLKPSPKWLLAGSYHSMWLASVSDGLYNSGGALVARSLTGTAGRHVGQELDAQATYIYSPQLQINGGLAHMIPGEFLKNTTPGHAYTYPYVMVTYVFLGEQPAIGARRGQ